MVRLIVDCMPENWTECVFAEKLPVDMFYARCKLVNDICELDSCGHCNRLISIRDVMEMNRR